MKKISLLVVFLVIISASAVFAHGGGNICKKQSWQMKPVDALIWTMANPTECGNDFLGYSRDIKYAVEDMTAADLKKPIVRKLIQKHVTDLEKHLAEGTGKLTYFGALDYEDSYEHMAFFKKRGFVSKFDDLALLKHLHSKIADVCAEEVRIIRSGKDSHGNSLDIHLLDLTRMMKKTGLTYTELGTSEQELVRLVEKESKPARQLRKPFWREILGI